LPAQKRKRPRGVVDTSVLVAGIAGFKSTEIAPKNPSANLLRDWIEGDTFVWLVSGEILLEYKRILGRLGVRRPLIGKIVNLLREEVDLVSTSALPNISPDPGDDPFCGYLRQDHFPAPFPDVLAHRLGLFFDRRVFFFGDFRSCRSRA